MSFLFITTLYLLEILIESSLLVLITKFKKIKLTSLKKCIAIILLWRVSILILGVALGLIGLIFLVLIKTSLIEIIFKNDFVLYGLTLIVLFYLIRKILKTNSKDTFWTIVDAHIYGFILYAVVFGLITSLIDPNQLQLDPWAISASEYTILGSLLIN